ncbi:ATP-binding protein [uncultured Brevundimonas sp.]|mgnify:FL=1|uniref:sensor histidine kinase n=1 Tax=uncultured Brevundimonas sp. TaxID=213418 RepID=UPI0030EE872F|tara:strand:+ start:3004 stop:4299 length:1296 start_codon:yes stop_codon:yes gene_type:complete
MMALAIIHPALMSWLIGASALVAGSVWWINRRRPDSGPAYALPETVGPTAQIADVELLEALFEALSDPVMVISGDEPADIADRRVVLANAAARELFRIPREGTLLISVLRDPQVLEAIDEALFGGVSRATEYFVRDRYWRASTGALTSGKSGRLGLVVLQDETDVRRMELMRVDFLANASHELRTPLASLSGFIETLKGHARDDEQARDRFLDIMTIQADRMSRLVADLLSLSRIELNEHVPPSGLVDLAGVCRDVMDAVSVLSDDRGIRVQLTEDDQRPAPVHGDRDEIIQVVQNLVDNATKYSPAGGVVEIAIRRDISLTEASAPWSGENRGDGATRLPLVTPGRVAGMHYMAVIVRDHGPGLAREHLPRLTERFYRVEGQKSGERAGTGLGLAIVKHIVNRHRGGLTVESAPGQGAKFTAYFPAAGDL